MKFCYEKQLAKNPSLNGKIVVKWVINGEGAVTAAQIVETQMHNADVENCIATKVRTWNFPKPKGGGIVVINFPFVMSSSEKSHAPK